ncbi:MAG: G5 domain-containing protein, partial [Armatimonadota bacterium]
MCNYAQRVTILGLVFVSSLSLMGFKKNDEKLETFTEKKVIKAETSFEFSRSVGLGRIVKKQDGKDGLVTRTYQLIKKDGKVVGKELVREERIEAIDTTYHVGKGGYNTSRGSFG